MSAYRQPKTLRRFLCQARLANDIGKNVHARNARCDVKGCRNTGKNCSVPPFTLPKCLKVHGIASNYTNELVHQLNWDFKKIV